MKFHFYNQYNDTPQTLDVEVDTSKLSVGEKQHITAARFNVSPSTISNIKRGFTWRD